MSYRDTLDESTSMLDEDNKTRKKATEAIDVYDDYLLETKEAQKEETSAVDDYLSRIADEQDAEEELESDLEKMAKALGMSTKELIDNADAAGMAVEDYYEIRSAMNGVVNEMKNLQSSYGSLNSIIEDYNDNGEISFENLESLLSLNPEYIGMLTMQMVNCN